MLQLTFNPGLTLTSFRTNRPWSLRNITTRKNWIRSLRLYYFMVERLGDRQRHQQGNSMCMQCLRRISQLVWPEKVSNIDLWQRSGQTSEEKALRRRKWKWLGHTLRETFLYHHQANSDLESSRDTKERSSTEHLETFARNRDQVHGQESVSAREAYTGQEAMERDCWCPMLLKRTEGRTTTN